MLMILCFCIVRRYNCEAAYGAYPYGAYPYGAYPYGYAVAAEEKKEE